MWTSAKSERVVVVIWFWAFELFFTHPPFSSVSLPPFPTVFAVAPSLPRHLNFKETSPTPSL